jgi:hypothetical protein
MFCKTMPGFDVDDVVLGQHRDSAGFVDPCGVECLPGAGAPAPLARFHWAQMPLEPHGAAGAEPPGEARAETGELAAVQVNGDGVPAV